MIGENGAVKKHSNLYNGERYRLLISNAVHIRIMKNRGIVDMASNDSDFERVAGINLWKP